METPNRHARRAALARARRNPTRSRRVVVIFDSTVPRGVRYAIATGPCGVRRYSVSRAVRALEASGEKARPR